MQCCNEKSNALEKNSIKSPKEYKTNHIHCFHQTHIRIWISSLRQLHLWVIRGNRKCSTTSGIVYNRSIRKYFAYLLFPVIWGPYLPKHIYVTQIPEMKAISNYLPMIDHYWGRTTFWSRSFHLPLVCGTNWNRLSEQYMRLIHLKSTLHVCFTNHIYVFFQRDL